MSYAVLAALGATLTLPGIAGFVLAIGMAVDANVLVFERAREEYDRRRRRSGGRCGPASRRRFSAIADSNVTTLLAAGLLFFLASGPVRGFGVTLSVGVIVSMFTALVVTRVLLETADRVGPGCCAGRRCPGSPASAGVRTWLTAPQPGPDAVARRRWLAVSASGGRGRADRHRSRAGWTTASSSPAAGWSSTRRHGRCRSTPPGRAVADAGLPRAVVQTSGDNEITVRGSDLSNETVQDLRARLRRPRRRRHAGARRADRAEPGRRAAHEGVDRARCRPRGTAGLSRLPVPVDVRGVGGGRRWRTTW